MPFDSLDDIYKRRQFPWIPVAIGAAVVLLAVLVWPSSGKEDEKEKEAAAETAAAAPEPAAKPAPEPVREAPPPPVPVAEATRTAPAEGGHEGDAFRAVLAEAKKFEGQTKPWEAREALLAALPKANAAQAAELEREIGRLSVDLFVSQRMCPGKVEYVVKGGDRIDKIRNAYDCPRLLIMRCNGIKDATKIQIGQRLVFPDHPKFQVVVSKSRNTLELRLNGKFFKRYVVATGADASTPVGTFEITDRVEHPAWKDIPYGDKRNILGTHWLKLAATGETPRAAGYGLHGTWDDSSLGKQASAGCVRLRNADIEELFVLLPLHTPVTIVD